VIQTTGWNHSRKNARPGTYQQRAWLISLAERAVGEKTLAHLPACRTNAHTLMSCGRRWRIGATRRRTLAHVSVIGVSTPVGIELVRSELLCGPLSRDSSQRTAVLSSKGQEEEADILIIETRVVVALMFRTDSRAIISDGKKQTRTLMGQGFVGTKRRMGKG
jgi:hypothetical protein